MSSLALVVTGQIAHVTRFCNVTETALMIGSLNPTGAGPPPAYRVEIDVTGITYTYLGIAAGGTGSEYTTPDSPHALTINGIT